MFLTALHITGMRTLADVRLQLASYEGLFARTRLTVLIGDNGSGKSTMIEACELMSRIPGEHFLEEVHEIHGGVPALFREGQNRLSLAVEIQGQFSTGEEFDYPVDLFSASYQLVLTVRGGFAIIAEESLTCDSADLLLRKGGQATYYKQTSPQVRSRGALRALPAFDEQRPLLPQFHRHIPAGHDCPMLDQVASMVLQVLRGIRVHLPFEVMPTWAARSLDRKSALRGSALFAPAKRLDMLGLNLANAYHALKNNFGQEQWQQTLDLVRLGLGYQVEDVTTWADPGGGQIGLGLKLRSLSRPLLAAQLSDGMLSYLAFVALFQLDGATLLAFDEPDLHLHPQLLARLVDLCEAKARRLPLLVATHSDRLLDLLNDPAGSVVLCELDENYATRLVRPDPETLQRWLERYRGLGDVRAAGYESAVMTRS